MRGVTLCLLFILPVAPLSSATSAPLPTRYGLSTLHGSSYDPEQIGLSILQGFALFDYDRVFRHAAPAGLRLKVEGNLGVTTDGRARSFGSVNMLALYYLAPRGERWRPYGEAGIGLIYTDFHVAGQGLHLNFNPQFGAGVEYAAGASRALFAGFRLHHVSNGGLHEDNRGINSWLLQLGVLWH